MKKLLALLLVLGLGGVAAYLAHEGKLDVGGLGSGREKALLKEKSLRFLECLKFKDFQAAAAFHSAKDLKENPDIPKLLEDFFLIPPESLDVQENFVDYVEFDSTGMRAKVKAKSTVRILNKDETRKPEVMLYWRRMGTEWFLDLRTTLERGRRGAP